jgi:hypothetical protein
MWILHEGALLGNFMNKDRFMPSVGVRVTIERARELNPNGTPLVERVRNAMVGQCGKLRSP